jgi:hypothetical protein
MSDLTPKGEGGSVVASSSARFKQSSSFLCPKTCVFIGSYPNIAEPSSRLCNPLISLTLISSYRASLLLGCFPSTLRIYLINSFPVAPYLVAPLLFSSFQNSFLNLAWCCLVQVPLVWLQFMSLAHSFPFLFSPVKIAR